MYSWERLELEERVEKQRREDERKRLEEISEQNARRMGPAPPVIPHNPQAARDGMLRQPGVDYDPRFPPQLVVTLPDPPRRTAGGDVPEVDGRSEAEKLRDPVNMLRRIVALEARVTQLEARNAEQKAA